MVVLFASTACRCGPCCPPVVPVVWKPDCRVLQALATQVGTAAADENAYKQRYNNLVKDQIKDLKELVLEVPIVCLQSLCESSVAWGALFLSSPRVDKWTEERLTCESAAPG